MSAFFSAAAVMHYFVEQTTTKKTHFGYEIFST